MAKPRIDHDVGMASVKLKHVVSSGLFITLLSLAAHANAEDWWTVSDGLTTLKVASDADSLHCMAGKCTIWERTRYANARPDGVSVQKDLAQYDCVGFKTATLEERSFGTNGAQTKAVRADTVTWQPVQEDSLGEALLTFACMYKAKKFASAPTGIMTIDQRQFIRETSSPSTATVASTSVAKASKPKIATAAPRAEVKAVLVAREGGSQSLHHGAFAVQIVAADRAENAQRALNELARNRGAVKSPLQARVEDVHEPGGKTIYRALIGDFPSEANATSFCAALRTGGADCLVRRRETNRP